METCLGIEIEMKPYLIKKLRTLAINKSEITGKNVVWQDIFNNIYNNAIKHSVEDVIEDQLIENLDLVEEKSKDNSLCNSCDVIYYNERGFMKLAYDLDLEKAALMMSSSEDKKLKEDYSGSDLGDIAVKVWAFNDDFKLKLEKYALELFIETISESVNEELMRDKNCWE